MTYKAPDGYIMESLPYPQEVTYTCECNDIADGTLISYETTGDSSTIGIKQVKITRVVSGNSMTITVVESNEQELQEYININTINN
jgi:hypothetical protein